MKRPLFLNEEESKRILDLHKKAINESLITEVTVTKVDKPSEDVLKSIFVGLECVKNHPDAKFYLRSDNTYQIEIGNYDYYAGANGIGRKKNMTTNEMSNYTCNDPEFQGLTPAAQTSSSFYGTDYVKQAQSLIGMPVDQQDGKFGPKTLEALKTKLGITTGGSKTASGGQGATGAAAATTTGTPAATTTTGGAPSASGGATGGQGATGAAAATNQTLNRDNF